MVLDDELARRARRSSRRAADRDRRARARDHAEPARLPGRSTASRARSTPRPARRSRRRRGRRSRERAASVDGRRRSSVEDPDLCPRFTARVFEDVQIGPVAAVAEGAADGRRPAPDLERRRHHQLRDAAAPASRCTRSTSTASPAARLVVRRARDGETIDDARRRQSARSTPTMVLIERRRGPDVDRRGHGRRALRGRADDTTRVLMEAANWNGAEHPAHLDAARRCAARPRAASRSSSSPSRRWTARRSRRS